MKSTMPEVKISPDAPASMHGWVLVEPKKLVWQETSVPSISPADVLIEVEAATTCGTDLKAFLRGHPQIPMPGPFGHEYAGRVAVAGEQTGFKPGDSVYGVHTAPCRNCRWCLRGQENLCESIMETKVLGSYAQYLLIPGRIASIHLFPRPAWLPPEEAAIIEPLACAVQGIQELAPRPDDSIAIIGPGAIGFLFALALKAKGVKNVTVFGRSKDRIEAGRNMGISCRTLSEIDSLPKFDAVIECTGSLEVWESAVNWTIKGGTVVLFGGLPSGTKAQFDAGILHYQQIKVISPFHFGTRAVSEARSLLESRAVSVKSLISGIRPMLELPQALEELEQRKGIKFALKP